MKWKKYFCALIITFALVAAPGFAEAQCAMCKQAAESSMKGDPNSMARSLNAGILYLMAVPYLMILFIFRKQIVKLWKSRFGRQNTPSVTE